MAKSAVQAIEYIGKSDAKIVREPRTTVVERVLEEMTTAHGRVSPKMLVDDAANTKHPLHKYFEWDDSEAAKRYRLTQATNMILSTRFVCMLVDKRRADGLKVIEDSPHATVRKLLPSYDEEHGYRPRAEVLSADETRKAFIDRKLGVLRSWCNSVVDVSELDATRAEILKLLK